MSATQLTEDRSTRANLPVWYAHIEPDWLPGGHWRWAASLLSVARRLAECEHELGDRVAVWREE